MTLAHAVLGFTALVAVLTVVPGLDTAVVLRGALSHSRGYGLATVIGIVTGLLVWGAAAGAGATAVLAASRTAYRVLSLAGALYVMWMGVSMLVRSFRGAGGWRGRAVAGPRTALDSAPEKTRAARAVEPTAPVERLPACASGRPGASLWRGWGVGLITDLLNPKAGVFYLATIPQFMAAGVPPLLMGVLLAAVHGLCCLIWLGALVLGASWLAPRMGAASGDVLERWTDRVTGMVLIGFGTRLALGTRV